MPPTTTIINAAVQPSTTNSNNEAISSLTSSSSLQLLPPNAAAAATSTTSSITITHQPSSHNTTVNIDNEIVSPPAVVEAHQHIVMKEEIEKSGDDELNSLISGSSNSSTEKTKKKDDKETKEYVLNYTLMDYGQLRCGRDCAYGGKCAQVLSVASICKYRYKTWGRREETAPTAKERKQVYKELMASNYNQVNKEFSFYVYDDDSSNGSKRRIQVCETGFIQIHGISFSTHSSKAPLQWKLAKQFIQNGEKDDPQEIKRIKSGRFKAKLDTAKTWIEFNSVKIADTSPNASRADIFIVPYSDIKSYYYEFKSNCLLYNFIPEDIPSIETFRRAFNDCKNIRLLGCKGSFQTCEICNNANELMRNTKKKYSRKQIEIVRSYKSLHIKQQASERDYLEKSKLRAKEFDDSTGQPKVALLFSDGMTIQRCNTPKVGKGRCSKGIKTIESRVIAVEVICGSIDTVFVYYTDDFVSGGANTMIEVQRQALIDLSKLLAEKNYHMPKELIFQFDNCGENKNKYMFSYLSLLIETFIFDKIEVNFLIVGHTHSSIDQFFSTLSKLIGSTSFIGSPIALEQLFTKAKEEANCSDESNKKSISIMRKLSSICYDFANAFAPFINNKIKVSIIILLNTL